MIETVFYVLSFFSQHANTHQPDLSEAYGSLHEARLARIKYMRAFKANEYVGADWGYWWSVSYESYLPNRFPDAKPKRVFYTWPKEECGILIQKVVVHG